MNRFLKILVLSVFVVFLATGGAFAVPITFTDTTTFFAGGTNDADLVSYGGNYFTSEQTLASLPEMIRRKGVWSDDILDLLANLF